MPDMAASNLPVSLPELFSHATLLAFFESPHEAELASELQLCPPPSTTCAPITSNATANTPIPNLRIASSIPSSACFHAKRHERSTRGNQGYPASQAVSASGGKGRAIRDPAGG